jgi:hypothetical protein
METTFKKFKSFILILYVGRLPLLKNLEIKLINE